MTPKEKLLVFHPARVFGSTERFLEMVLPLWSRHYEIHLISTSIILERLSLPKDIKTYPLAYKYLEQRFYPIVRYLYLLNHIKPSKILVFVIAYQSVIFSLTALLLGLRKKLLLRYDGFVTKYVPENGSLLKILSFLNRKVRGIISPSKGVAKELLYRLGAHPKKYMFSQIL